ncbi:hypothetical protein ABFX02_12G060700 [Erythranthe guttata]
MSCFYIVSCYLGIEPPTALFYYFFFVKKVGTISFILFARYDPRLFCDLSNPLDWSRRYFFIRSRLPWFFPTTPVSETPFQEPVPSNLQSEVETVNSFFRHSMLNVEKVVNSLLLMLGFGLAVSSLPMTSVRDCGDDTAFTCFERIYEFSFFLFFRLRLVFLLLFLFIRCVRDESI